MKEKIHAVSNNGLARLLESLGLTESIEKGLLSCAYCGKKISQENVGCIYPLENEIRLCCDALECLEKAIDEITPARSLSNRGEGRNES